MALLLYKNASTGAIYRGCSGVLVGDRQVLTSAYCIEKAEL
jgi:V8-like Glu-specific endopeptidase